ncbi:hypothetical protein ONZ45_g10486 [Pleurotus djamor]|nr:hypothetical protein ONZ45_g10486 [Pleurotus djamor]
MNVAHASTQETFLSSILKLTAHPDYPAHATHPYASNSEAPAALLERLVRLSDNATVCLQKFVALPVTQPKLVSLLREHSTMSSSLSILDHSTQVFIDSLKKREEPSYGEDVPIDRSAISAWSVSRLEAFGKATGMEIFQEPRDGGISLVLAGKVIVIDVDLGLEQGDPMQSTIHVANVKTSYAIPSASTHAASKSLDELIKDSIQAFLTEVQKPDATMSPREAARLGREIKNHLSYIVMLDQLATQSGIQWFSDVDILASKLDRFAKQESDAVASTHSSQQASLDVYLLRAHSLPLPYLKRPCISFLVFLSPLAYLRLLRSIPPALPPLISPSLPSFDIPLSHLRSSLVSQPAGATIATLSLEKSHHLPVHHTLPSVPPESSRPSFHLPRAETRDDHHLPKFTAQTRGEDPSDYNWVLDFTDEGRTSGVVMTQTRMREIEYLVKGVNHDTPQNMMMMNTESWLNLLLNPGEHVSPERYTALFRSPTSLHPPLQLRLTAPDEPGYFLQKVRVCSMKQVWGILEIVKEQCWLNEIILGCQWVPEGLNAGIDIEKEEESEVTEDDLQAVLAGTLVPRKLPVNVTLPSFSQSDLDPLALDDDGLDILHTSTTPSRPRILMSSPERPPMSGEVQITVEYDETRPRGLKVDISGMIGLDLNKEIMEEVSLNAH